MARLIDADALFKVIKTDKVAWRFGVPNTLKLMFDWLKLIIRDQPTVDAVEVVHGRWEYHDPVSPNCFCSVCHHDAPWDDFAYYHADRTNYCPNCGAKMDGGNEDV